MFSLRCTSESEVKGVIELSEPLRGLGFITDIHGEEWDIRGIIGNYVQAVKRSELHPYYTDTSGMGGYELVSQSWEPYEIKVID